MNRDKFYPEANNNVDPRDLENRVLTFWNERQIFDLSLEKNRDRDFVFFDGPPFANGLPHYGHLLAGYIKDTVARYQTMMGKRVQRKFGWDCHGLPAEQSAESALGLAGRGAIEEYGIEKFNNYCQEDVLRYVNEWKRYVNRSGRWVDFDNGYRTMNLDYMESIMWVFKRLYEKGLLYEDYRVMPYSWKCQTPLSNMETRMDNSFRERADRAVTAKFELEQLPTLLEGWEATNVYLLVWTTTPWTLTSNLALALSGTLNYALIRRGDEFYLIGEKAIGRYERELADGDGRLNIVKVLGGNDLLGLSYRPLFDYLLSNPEVQRSEKCFTILRGDFVTEEEGTCIVHVAPGFGEDDQLICRAAGIPTICPVDDGGCFTDVIYDHAGQQVFDSNDQLIAKLKQKNLWFKTEQYLHNYPHCWRTDTPLIYRAMSSWFVDVPKIRDKIIENNELINWIPGHVKHGRFGKWLEGAREWSISRNRFWGCPIPLWKSNDPKYPRIDVYGSLDELERDFGVRPKNLHRPFIDRLTRRNPDDPTGKSLMVRVPEVLDCWFESGAMPYAQLHYPFENREYFENNFPADFIAEGDGQLRGWFYTLLVLSTALFDRNPFKNCISFGTIVDENGKKLSKRLRNYVDPFEAFDTYGSDAIRWLMLKSPALKGEEMRISKDGRDMREILRLALRPVLNSYNFFCLYANSDSLEAEDILRIEDLFAVRVGRGAQLARDSRLAEGLAEERPSEAGHRDGGKDLEYYVFYRRARPVASARVRSEGAVVKIEKFSSSRELGDRPPLRQFIKYTIGKLLGTDAVERIDISLPSSSKDFCETLGFRAMAGGGESGDAGAGYSRMTALARDLLGKDYSQGNSLLDNSMDIYILSKLRETVQRMRTEMDSYNFGNACREAENFFDILNNWYIRRNRNRFWKSEKDADKQNAYNVLYSVLLTMARAIAPLAPFLSEHLWRGLTGSPSENRR
ncbi:MAG: isoleucine--tRNA ligase [Rickettsiales bacterium]|jgi:isoleucyl-tRNA synthetase|nr:isoleucine--tRNA ligase [Rickettsiales bacterium]